jgi:hypothetical protein
VSKAAYTSANIRDLMREIAGAEDCSGSAREAPRTSRHIANLFSRWRREAKMPDANEPAGQAVKPQAADELLSLESHPLLFVSLVVVFPAECDLAAVEMDQTVIVIK